MVLFTILGNHQYFQYSNSSSTRLMVAQKWGLLSFIIGIRGTKESRDKYNWR